MQIKLGLASAAVAASAITGVLGMSASAGAAPVAPQTSTVVAPNTAAQAIAWYSSRNGSTAYEGYCEKAARLSWNRTTHHASAIDHWNSSDGAKHTTGTPPKGAFVFWNISSFGHVGVADGNGGFWSTSISGHIGHATSVSHFSNYLGWKPGNSN